MSTVETLQATEEGMTLDLLLWRRFAVERRGQVEVTYAANRELAELGPVLPLGTQVEVEVPAPTTARPMRVLRLWG